ncbi:class I SAM-dependent methyltransferase [Methylotenera oryzisoli]|nr:class I SAM-dependent methyltransferase [Methylotenera oryzisoli]
MKNEIKTKTKSNCICCGSEGFFLYKSLNDRLFGTKGEWNIKQCNNIECGLLWLDPMPVSEDLYKIYESYYTHTDRPNEERSFFSRVVLGYQAAIYDFLYDQTNSYYRFLGRLLSKLNVFKDYMDYPFVYLKGLPKGKLLELGCGNGDTLDILTKWGWQAEGLDFDDNAVNVAASKGLLVHKGDIFAQNFSDSSFDVVFSNNVIEHVSDPFALLKESARVIKPGGFLVAITPNAGSKLHQKFKENWRGLEPPRHLYLFKSNSLASIAKTAGFQDVKVISKNYSAIFIWLMSSKLKNYDGNIGSHSRTSRYLSYLAGFYLNVAQRFSPLSGEELILVAYK